MSELISGWKPSSKDFIRVYMEGFRNNVRWERLNVEELIEDSLIIQGDLATRLLNMLEFNNLNFRTFDCHAAAFYGLGMTNQPRTDALDEIYEENLMDFTYEPQEGPALVHLLHEKIDIKEGIDFYTPHSVIFLGELFDVPIVFEKQGNTIPKFSKLKSVEKLYDTKVRLYVVPK